MSSRSRKRSRTEVSSAMVAETTSVMENTTNNSMLPPPPQSSSPATAASNDNKDSQKGGVDKDDTADDFVLSSKLNSLPSLWSDTNPPPRTRAAPRSAAGRASCSNSSTLFGRVMQSASKHGNSSNSEDTASHHTQQQQQQPQIFQTPTKAKRPPASSSLLSPGGFTLRNAVEAASPFAFANNYKNDDASNSALSAASTPPQPAWRRATSPCVWDGSLKEKVVFQCPAFENDLASWRWMQRTVTLNSHCFGTNDATNKQPKMTPAQQWQMARTYWQYSHPGGEAPCPMDTAATTRNVSKLPKEWANASESVLQMEQQQPSKLAAATKLEKASPSDLACQQLQQQRPANDHGAKWRTAVTSAFQAWRMGTLPYFYARGTDHTLLFLSCDDDDKSSKTSSPRILISACDRHFREWCRSQDVTLYVSDSHNTDKEWNEDGWKEGEQQKLNRQQADRHSPSSPEAAAELAALRRAHVTGQTVGADVSVSFRAAARKDHSLRLRQRRVWQQVPALYVRGWDACAAVAEYYINRGGQVTGDRTTTTTADWPVVLAPQPFAHATVQHADVRWLPRDGQVQVRGWLLPDGVRALLQAVVNALQEMDDDVDGVEESHDNVRLQATLTTAKVTGSVVRPLEDVVIGQPNLLALMDDDEGETVTSSPDVVAQVVWESDEPDALSYRVTPGGVA